MLYYLIHDICVCCGKPVPEGRQICEQCEKQVTDNKLLRKNRKEHRDKHGVMKSEH